MTHFGIFAVGMIVGAALGWIEAWREMSPSVVGAAPTPEPPRPRCPYCGSTLRAVTVRDLGEPIPAEAEWICPHVECTAWWFAERPAAKPAAVEVDEGRL